MLSLRNIEVRFGQAVAVSGASLEVPHGGWVALVGPNGAGKTSLLRAAMGLVQARGLIRLDGKDLGTLPAWERQQRGIGFVPEGRQVFPQMSVEENLRVGAYNCTPAQIRRGLDSAYAMFPRLAERSAQHAGTLSGGEQQMLALARALMAAPRLLLIDEISWGLMPILVAQVFAHLKMLHAGGLTILQVEQNTHEVLRFAQHAYVMAAGQIEIDGPARDVARDPRVLETYVG
jgi:branched-chain amino acid transport system ATP-binding protein